MKKFIEKTILLSIALFLLLFNNACVQEEGYGGNSSINGIVIKQTFLKDESNLLFEAPAKDEDVFLVFGTDQVIGDDVATSYEGYFQFNYLWPGDYKIYCYGDSAFNADKIEVVKTVSLTRGEIISLDTIYIKKIVDVDDGNASVSGRIIERTYNEDFSILLSETVAKDEDVFIQFAGSTNLVDDVKTSSTGEFVFEKLWAGDYSVYSYSDTSITGGTDQVITEVSLENNESINAGDIIVNRIADWDEGRATIKGSILTNYSGSTIKDISAAQEQEVYLVYNNHQYYDERIRTGYDGIFEFRNLILGDYKIYVYSDDVVTGGTEKEVVSFNVTISKTDEVIDLGSFNVNQN